jgi:curved DNA-binding protein CbpA
MALSLDLCPILKSGVKLESLPLTPTEGFVMSRVNGLTPIREIISTTALPEKEVQAALIKLEQLGAIEWQKIQTAAPRSKSSSTLPQATAKQAPADISLTLERLDLMFRSLRHQDLYQVLGVPRTASDEEIKTAYAGLSREFHPDRFFNMNLGTRKDVLDTVFARISEAYETLRNKSKRAVYDNSILPPELRQEKPRGALDSKPKYQASDPSRIVALAEADLRSGNYANAIKNFKIAAAMDPANRDFAKRLNFVETMQSTLSSVEKLNKDPSGAMALEDKVVVPLLNKLKKEQDLFPVDEKVFTPLIRFALNFDYDAHLALDFADKLYRRSQRAPHAILLGRAHEKDQNFQEALKFYQKALDLDPKAKEATGLIDELKKRKR